MALLGSAALAMWWDVAPENRPGFEHWHTSEHFPERLHVPGFLRGTRWTALSGRPHYFVMYELDDLGVLASPTYRDRVNAPTPWTRQVMANFRNMVRSQCRVRCSDGAGLAQTLLTVRFSPAPGGEPELSAWLAEELLPALVARPGISSAHVLQNMVPAVPLHEQTAEQKLRGGDSAADWALLVNGYGRMQVSGLADDELHADALARRGMGDRLDVGLYELAYAMGQPDVAQAQARA